MGKKKQTDTIFVIEDDPGLLHLIEKTIQRLGFNTKGELDASRSIEMIKKDPPRLLILDYQLVDLTGKEVIKALEEIGCLPPFITITGHGNETIAVEMMKLGALDYLVKDGSFLELLPTVVKHSLIHLSMEEKIAKSEQENQKLEAQLVHSQKMEAIGTLAGGIAHDFNNILAGILGFAEMAKDDIESSNPAIYKIDQVINAGNRAKGLVAQILAFGRKTDQGQVQVQIYPLVKETLKFLRASIPTTISIEQEIDHNSGFIKADPTQIHQVIMNICTNASQAMDEKGGILKVKLRSKQLGDQELLHKPDFKPGSYILLSVKDNGIGMDQATLKRIFEPYFTTKDVGKGLGMGLAVVHGIVKNHCGMIDVKSSLGKGSVINIYFPKIEVEKKIEVKLKAPIPKGTQNILLVDDEAMVVDITKLRLQRLNYTVSSKTSSLEALELFRSNPDDFDLVITDQTMPGLTGIKLAQKLIAIRPDIPIILCTGYSNKIDENDTNAVGIKAFLMKPLEMRELAIIVKNTLENT